MREAGARLRLSIGVSEFAEQAFARDGKKPPVPVEVTALIDTGSGRSILQKDLVAELELNPVGAVEIDTPSSTDVSVFEYYARFWFDSATSVEVKVLEAPLNVPTVRALVGRDILERGRLDYDGREGWFSLHM